MRKAPRNPVKRILKMAFEREPSELDSREKSSQLSLDIERKTQEDRNFSQGGRSFYFFDFDDNVAFLTTSIYLFHKETREEIALSSGDFARVSQAVGKRGEFKNHEVDFDDFKGSFRDFRDKNIGLIEKVLGQKKQPFVQDIAHALGQEDFHWKGPSWDCFYHAVFNKRPLSVITARGHNPNTIQRGIHELVRERHLPYRPNYLSVYPVTHTETRRDLGDHAMSFSVAELKKRAIQASVEEAFKKYEYNEFHRFGMSDDDPKNIDLITEAMLILKKQYPHNSFFVFDASHNRLLKKEVFLEYVKEEEVTQEQQLSLFGKGDNA